MVFAQAFIASAPLGLLLGLVVLAVIVFLAYRRARHAWRLSSDGDDTLVTCPICHGSGRIYLLPNMSGISEVCVYCNGSGKVPRSALLDT